MRRLDKRLGALESKVLPEQMVVFIRTYRRDGRSDPIRIATLDRAQEWHREPNETVREFRRRVRDEVNKAEAVVVLIDHNDDSVQVDHPLAN